MKKPDLPILFFKTQPEFRDWLEKNHGTSSGVWLKFFKKDSGVKTLVYAEALDEALCYGWIDGQTKSADEKSYLQRFTPRRPKSIWSKRNTEHIARLTKLGKIKPAGITQVEAAKKDGRWEQAYDSLKNMVIPDDFLRELDKNVKAKAFFETLNRSNLYAIFYRLQTAKKPEIRTRRMNVILEKLQKGEKFHE